MNPADIYNLGETKILQSGKANKTWVSKSAASFRRIFKNRFHTKTCYPNRFLVDTLLVHSVHPSVVRVSTSQAHHISNQKGDLWAKWQKWEKWLACSLGCVHPMWNPFCTRMPFFRHIHAHPRSQKHPPIENLQLLRYDGHVHWPDCRSLHHGRCGGGEDLGTSGEVHLQGRSWHGKQDEVLDYGEVGTWQRKHVLQEIEVLPSCLPCTRAQVRHVSKVFRKSVKLQLDGWKDTERDRAGSSAQGLGLLVTLLTLDSNLWRKKIQWYLHPTKNDTSIDPKQCK